MYWMMIIIIKPNEFAKPAINLDFHSDWFLILIEPLTLKELENSNDDAKLEVAESSQN